MPKPYAPCWLGISRTALFQRSGRGTAFLEKLQHLKDHRKQSEPLLYTIKQKTFVLYLIVERSTVPTYEMIRQSDEIRQNPSWSTKAAALICLW